jgi:hypothetical protein
LHRQRVELVTGRLLGAGARRAGWGDHRAGGAAAGLDPPQHGDVSTDRTGVRRNRSADKDMRRRRCDSSIGFRMSPAIHRLQQLAGRSGRLDLCCSGHLGQQREQRSLHARRNAGRHHAVRIAMLAEAQRESTGAGHGGGMPVPPSGRRPVSACSQLEAAAVIASWAEALLKLIHFGS